MAFPCASGCFKGRGAVQSAPMTFLDYNELTGRELVEASGPDNVIFLPIAAPENHGEHLPLGTDLFISEAMAKIAGKAYCQIHPESKIFIYPPISVGGATIRGAGSVKVRSKDLERCLIFLGRRLVKQGFRKIVFVSGHGGVPHVNAMDRAAFRITRIIRKHGQGAAFAPAALFAGNVYAGRYVDNWQKMGVELPDNVWDILPNDLHGGWLETSMMLYLRPDLVRESYKTAPMIRPKDRSWLNALEGAIGWGVNRLPLAEQTRQGLLFGLKIGKIDLSWILQGRQKGYCGYPGLATSQFGKTLLHFVCGEIAVAMDRVFRGEVSPLAYRSVGYLFPWLVRGVAIFLIAVATGIFIITTQGA